jgi:hypothetical protein
MDAPAKTGAGLVNLDRAAAVFEIVIEKFAPGATPFVITTMCAKFIPDFAPDIQRNTFPIIALVVGG